MKKNLRSFFYVLFIFLSVNESCFAQQHFNSHIGSSVKKSHPKINSASDSTYWNEWINFSQPYYKIPIAKDGVYRLDSITLAHAGISLQSFDLSNIQIFYQGQEQYIFVSDKNGDNKFNANDYIEFYGKHNDGTLDTIFYKGVLYNKPIKQPNPYYSLHSDTSMYFFTWNNSSNNHRITMAYDTSYAPYNSSPYFWKQYITENHTQYYYGFATITNINYPDYGEVEGWAGTRFGIACGGCPSSFTESFNTSNIYIGDPNVQVQVKLAVMGESADVNTTDDHKVQISYSNGGPFTLFDTDILPGYRLFDSTYNFLASNFINSSTNIKFTPQLTTSQLTEPNPTSSCAVPYVTFKLPHIANLESQNYYEMTVPTQTVQPYSYYSFSNFTASSPAYLYDFTNHTRIPMTKSGSSPFFSYKVLVKNSSFPNSPDKFCVATSEGQSTIPSSIKPVNGTGFFTDYSSPAYTSLDSAFIIITNKSLMSGATSYAAYRSSILGGNHKTLVADIDELVDQFGYGIPKHPFGIRHFIDYCLNKFQTPPQNLFLIGKSIQEDKKRDPTSANYAICLVPTMSYPSCDNMLVAGLNNTLLSSPINLGRLAAQNISDITTYLNKVKDYEHPSPNPAEWMKNIIHISGGDNAGQQAQFAAYLVGYKNIIQDTLFGGFVHSFAKNASSPTQTSFADSIKELIDTGVSVITFFGHTSASVFEFNLLPPDQYSNSNGRYPFFIADGCVAGDIHEPPSEGASSSEIYTLSSRGTIDFLGTSGPGTAPELDLFTQNLYEDFGNKLYGKPIGRCIRAAVDSIQKYSPSGSNDLINAVCLEITLHGDPSIVIHASAKPDYAIKTSSVYFNPTYVSTDLTTFDMNIIITNLGKAVNDTVLVNVKRIFADGTSSTYSSKIPKIYFKDTLKITMPVDPIHGPGLNNFEVHVNVPHNPDELSFSNNDIDAAHGGTVPLMIYSGDIIPVYPYKYAIIPNNTTILKGNTSNPFAASARYVFEIDTTDLYSSPLLKIQKVTQAGAIVNALPTLWSSPPLILKDSVVYYWRVRRDTIDTIHFPWRESSFQYIPGKRGWGQSHFFQYLKGDKYNYITTSRTTRTFGFSTQNHSITVQTLNFTKSGRGLNNASQIYFEYDALYKTLTSLISSEDSDLSRPVRPHVIISVIDPLTGNIWQNDLSGKYGSYHPIWTTGFRYSYEFLTGTVAQQDSISHFIQNIIPTGSKVIFYVDDDHNLGDILNGNSPHTNPGLVQALQSVGGVQFPNIRNNYPYILIGRKGGNAIEKIGSNLGSNLASKIILTDTVGVSRSSGYVYSEIIGPASNWKSLHWNYFAHHGTGAQDLAKIYLLGINNNTGKTDTLIRGITKDSLDISNINPPANAAVYSNLQLMAWFEDSIKRTPVTLRKWQIYYDGVPEAALNPVKNYSFYASKVQQGDSIKFTVAVQNIGDYNFNDSIETNFWVLDANRNKVLPVSKKIKALKIDSFDVAKIKVSTASLPGGVNSLWIEANPFDTKHQSEEYHFNNFGTVPFTLAVDKINPLLDVTFDGVHIMNGDIVSAKPVVAINVKDENTFLALNDQSAFKVFLQSPRHSTFDTIPFGPQLSFQPAVLPNNTCKITYNPVLPDGIYQLRVQGKDRSGNFSGNTSYQISYEVINKPTVTNVLNYPNPFSTSTRFVFTLTGSQVPDYFKIQILTITGKIVKEIDRFQLGLLHIGRNITDYAWDGKDEFGDQLANGIYLYRVVTQLNGKSLEHRDSGVDSFFTQGYGKMYLIR